MAYNPQNPLIVQSDRSLLLEVDNPHYEAARDELVRWAELEKSPEHIHTYRVTPLSLWNAAAAGHGAAEIVAALERYSKFDVPGNVLADVRDYIGRFGRVKLVRENGALLLRSSDRLLITEIERHSHTARYLVGRVDDFTLLVDAAARGHIKHALVEFGYPAEDLAGYVTGEKLAVALRPTTLGGRAFDLRAYQQAAVDAFWAGGDRRGGSGVVVLPCGAGKTIVGAGALDKIQAHTLILCPSTIAVRQWISELLDKTTLTADQIGEYTGEKKEIRPITVTTYQIMTYRPFKADEETGEVGEFPHFQLFTNHDWGLIIYDEVHLLPAPVFRVTAELQARRRLGLTATLVREDGREEDVFSLIGPKKYDVPWKDLEAQGWIATALCTEVRLPMPPSTRLEYVLSEDNRIKYRVAAENPLKLQALHVLLERHRADNVLIIGQYLSQLAEIAAQVDAPLITGKTPNQERADLYEDFRQGRVKCLIVSKVANFAIDLPDANVAIQVSGTFGSRQEEAQRLGRILRPKPDGAPANFYTLVTRDSKDQDFSANRQLFLTEQGYRYEIVDGGDLLPGMTAGLAEEQAILDNEGASALAEWAAARRIQRRSAVPQSAVPHGDDEDEPGRNGSAPKRRGRPPKAKIIPLPLPAPAHTNGTTNGVAADAPRRGRRRDHLRVVK